MSEGNGSEEEKWYEEGKFECEINGVFILMGEDGTGHE